MRIFLSVIALSVSQCCGQPQPTALPLEFSAAFSETFTINGSPVPDSTGAWYYAFDRGLWRADHDSPQMNNVR